jgi:glutamine amidotransferase
VVLPGVGAFGDCRRGLDRLDGMMAALTEAVTTKGRPFLGICVGMQLMADAGLEHGRHPGFGWIAGEVREIAPDDPALKVPHMGWNALTFHRPHPVLDGIADGTDVYFVHSYHLAVKDPGDRLATTDHGGAITAAVGRGNMVGTQFHPEKSQAAGLRLIGNFLRWRP